MEKLSAILLLLMGLISTRTFAAYTELYRPQFHFSPLNGWVGDPDGTIRYQNTYHLFWWGHATSTDLVHWVEQPYPMAGGPANMAYFSGSAVVDKNNTAGFGSPSNPAMVAIYTGHNNTTGEEDQRLSTSTNYTVFNHYSGNPVLDSPDPVFRDPEVFWDEQTSRWIMVVSRAEKRWLEFYASSNLKSWQYLSQFGPVAARDEWWEVAGLVRVPVSGDFQTKKWVLFCGKGPNKIQYWVGNFNGTNFVMDAATQNYITQGAGLEGSAFANFESSNYGSWTKTGSAFGSGPVIGPSGISGYLGSRLVNSYGSGDANTGTLTSPPFLITNTCINFLISGGNHPGQTCINLIVGGNVVKTATGQDSGIMRWAGWDVSAWQGQSAQLQIVDSHTGGWGHINVDHILLSDVLRNYNLEHANWVDWGSDFYAARVYRDYDGAEECVTWIAWMGNWRYANSVPTSWGKGAESIPRNIQLTPTPRGYEIVQQPIPRLKTLRGTPVKAGPRIIQNTNSIPGFAPTRNTYEVEAVFNVHSQSQNFGMNFCVAGTNKVVVGYDAKTSVVYLDRRASGNMSFSAEFPNIVYAPLKLTGDTIKFQVLLDQSSIEVFANDGERVLTSLIFPAANSLGFEVFSKNGETTLRTFQAWPLGSIWN